MKFQCPLCKVILNKDMRGNFVKLFIKDGKYKGFCRKFKKDVLCERVKK